MAKKKKRTQSFYDYSLLFCIVFLTIFGLIMIYSASSYKAQLDYDGNAAYFMNRQAVIAAGSFVVMLLISKMDYHWYSKFATFAYVLSLALMIAVALVGHEVNGKKRWLGVGAFRFQPTELVKITLIVVIATMITMLGNKINRLKAVGLIIGVSIPVAFLVAMNNLSSGIIICGIVFVMLFVSTKKKWRYFLCAGLGGLVFVFAAPIAHALTALKILQPYQLSRINVWLDPEAYPLDGGFQVLQGLYAIGSGGLFGKGLGESIQKMGFVPEAQNDMIFSIICEELGLFGAISLHPDLRIYDLSVYPDRRKRTGSVWSSDRSRRYGTYCDPGYFEYCGCDQQHSQYGHYFAVHQLWRYFDFIPHDGDGNGTQCLKSDKVGKIRNQYHAFT